MTERWMPVLNYESHYEVSDIGRLRRISGGSGTHLGKINKPGSRRAYLNYTLSVDCVTRTFSAHRLVWEAFHGLIPDGLEINHKNGIKNDNRLVNLETCTKSENQLHAINILGITQNIPPRLIGSRNHKAIVNEEQVKEIRRIYSLGGVSQQVLADRFGLDQTSVSHIVRRSTWPHVE